MTLKWVFKQRSFRYSSISVLWSLFATLRDHGLKNNGISSHLLIYKKNFDEDFDTSKREAFFQFVKHPEIQTHTITGGSGAKLDN